MNAQEKIARLEELEAGRILGDLDADEVKEWRELSKSPGRQVDISMELVAAAIEAEFLDAGNVELPKHMTEALQVGMEEFVIPTEDQKIVQLSSWKNLASRDWLAWAAAAVFAALFVASPVIWKNNSTSTAKNPPELTPETAKDQMLGQANDLVQSEFSGTDNYAKVTGNVVWSDSLQEGYMTLSNLPANDPTKKQYQLWIVDPARDEKPVDGGVFDIPSGSKTAVIPIRNPLIVSNPKAFVITLEQPGGVVVSKQEEVVALATVS